MAIGMGLAILSPMQGSLWTWSTVTVHSVVPQGLKPNSLSALCGPTKVGPLEFLHIQG
jgi:hypothetical protein